MDEAIEPSRRWRFWSDRWRSCCTAHMSVWAHQTIRELKSKIKSRNLSRIYQASTEAYFLSIKNTFSLKVSARNSIMCFADLCLIVNLSFWNEACGSFRLLVLSLFCGYTSFVKLINRFSKSWWDLTINPSIDKYSAINALKWFQKNIWIHTTTRKHVFTDRFYRLPM